MRLGQFIEYRGYIGSIEFDLETEHYHGYLLNIDDFVNYLGNDGLELYENYKNAVDDYIEFKKEVGKQ